MDWRYDFAKGDLVAGRLNNTDGWRLGGACYAANIGGEPSKITEHTGKWSILQAGFDLLVPSGGTLGPEEASHAPGPFTAGVRDVLIAHGTRILKIRLPGNMAICSAIPGGVRWNARTAYLSSSYGPTASCASQLKFRSRPVKIRGIPSPPAVVRLVCVLANGTLCGQYRWPKEALPDRLDDYVAWIFNTHTWKWQSYPGLMIYGGSANGRYVVYSWYKVPAMHMARISGEE